MRDNGPVGAGNLEICDLHVSLGGGVAVLDGVTLSVPAGSITTVLGRSGCGKTTMLRALAGLEIPTAGTICIGDWVVAADSIDVPPERRGVGMVFQDHALFPHLTVAQNVGFGLPRGERSGPRVAEALALVGLTGFDHRSPDTLSGGQQQRVALARALAPRPSVLVLDEPFASLDSVLRAELRAEVRRILSDLGVTTVFVTHDREEAFEMGDRLAVMRAGRIVQDDLPAAVYRHPVDADVASLVGEVNLLDGRIGSDRCGSAATVVGDVAVSADCDAGPVVVLLRPEDLVLTPMGSGERAMGPGASGTVRQVRFHGRDRSVAVAVNAGVTADAAGTGESDEVVVWVRTIDDPGPVGSLVRMRPSSRTVHCWSAPS